jgi:hypothetical protein
LRGHMPTNHSGPFKRFQTAPLSGSAP